MKGFDVLHVKSAVKSHNKFDLSKTHLTTMNFGEIVPLYVEETVPGDKFHIKADYFSRLAPLVKPTYGKFSFRTVSAFVPYFQVAEDCEAWFAGKTTWQSYTPVQRKFTFTTLFNFVLNYCLTTSGASATNYDYVYIDASNTTVYTLYTTVGKYYIKILNALGYALPSYVDLAPGTWKDDIGDVTYLSAYPLLAFFKLYNDYMSQSQRYNTSVLSFYLNSVKYNKSCTGYTPSTGVMNETFISNLFGSLYLNYDNDYFTSAWQSANCALTSTEGVGSVNVPGFNTAGAVDSLGTSNLSTYAIINNKTTLSQRALDFLQSFDNWVRRNSYSGSREVQQIYSRFGIKTDDYRTHYAHVLSTDVMPVQVGDVTATADSSQIPLGDYAGKGIMSGRKDINYEVSDYGIFFVFGYFTVAPMNSYGFDRRVHRTQPLDYYNPEFDGLGADAISVAEVYESPILVGSGQASDDVFGFTERYNSYRYGRDVITGDFRDYHASGDMNCWHTGRNLSALRANNQLVAQSSQMNTLPQINSEYNRIFAVTSGDVDHFYLTAHFTVDAVRPMLNLNQVAQLGEGDTTVPRNGNVIS